MKGNNALDLAKTHKVITSNRKYAAYLLSMGLQSKAMGQSERATALDG